MNPLIQWLRKNKFKAHLTLFVIIIISSLGMFFALSTGGYTMVWLFIGCCALANLATIFIK